MGNIQQQELQCQRRGSGLDQPHGAYYQQAVCLALWLSQTTMADKINMYGIYTLPKNEAFVTATCDLEEQNAVGSVKSLKPEE